MNQKITAVILAAGKGTRMKSAKAKVLHEVFFKPMLHHVLDGVQQTGIEKISIIVGHQKDTVLTSLTHYPHEPVFQEEQLGTGHAVLCAEKSCAASEVVMILCGDTPLIQAETLTSMIEFHHDNQNCVSLMTTILGDPFGYGRIISDKNKNIMRIVEQKDATPQELQVKEINTGIYLVERKFLFQALKNIGTDNSQGEVYLTDLIGITRDRGKKIQSFQHPAAIDVLGVNSRVELAKARAELQKRHNRKLMLCGVTMHNPDTTLINPDSSIDRDTVIEQGVMVTNKSAIGNDCYIQANVQINKCSIGSRAVIGAGSVLHNCTIENEEHVPPLTYRVA
jgi:bifunctional UDP-N-acetylglucosamine pyrophosphorylase/glucosamine-1-phosphate N-acetyltransferase